MVTDTDIKFLKMAIANSQRSFEEGRFPAGAVVVKDNKVISSTFNSPTPTPLHPDSLALLNAFSQVGSLKGATLYIGLESCLMCTGIAYWSGLRRIVYTIPKSKVSGDYYETHAPTQELIDSFNNQIERIHISELEKEALQVIKEWENKYL